MEDVSYQDEITAVLKKVIGNTNGEVLSLNNQKRINVKILCFEIIFQLFSFQTFCSMVLQEQEKRQLFWLLVQLTSHSLHD